MRRREDRFTPDPLETCDFHDRESRTLELNSSDLSTDLFCVSRQIYQEAMPLFYALNRFRCDGIEASHSFMRAIGPERLKHVQDVTLDLAPLDSCWGEWKELLGLQGRSPLWESSIDWSSWSTMATGSA